MHSISIAMSYQIFCMGNPLLDVQVRDGEALLKKYGLEPNNAIRFAEENHQRLCVDPIFPFDRVTTFTVVTRTSLKTTPSRTSLEEGARTLRVELL